MIKVRITGFNKNEIRKNKEEFIGKTFFLIKPHPPEGIVVEKEGGGKRTILFSPKYEKIY
ncbi:MAG: hypothetical protein GF387_00815 [Candidatus Portnoybacteria bacterium]|nr:hypothetical protein [Candidatus Portnoybacteria bacterium]